MGSCTEHKFFYSCYVIIDHHVIHIFYIILLPLSRIASSGFYPIFTMQKTVCKNMSIRIKGKRFSVWSKESFLKLGIRLWTECVCLCIWNISLLLLLSFCLWVLQLMREGKLWVTYEYFNVLVVSLCKPVVYKLKILDGGKLQYYKWMGGTTKKREEGTKFWNFSGGKQKRRNTIFDSNLVKENIGGNYVEKIVKKPFLRANSNMNKNSSKKKI